MIIVQARMGSQRLPGKSLMKIKDKTVLEHVIQALESRFDKEDIVIATSSAPGNEGIVELCKTLGVAVFAGDETNVASRFLNIVKEFKSDYFVRISADSPLLDPNSIAQAVNKLSDNLEMVSTRGGGFPSGMNTEVLRSDFFIQNYPKFNKPAHFEHVTAYFYENGFEIKKVDCSVAGMDEMKFSLDTPDDLRRIEKIFGMMTKPHYQYLLQEKAELYKKAAEEFLR